LKIPTGPWAKGRKEKQIGIMTQKDLVDGVEGISTKLLLMIGYEPENLKVFFEEIKKELMDPKVSFYIVSSKVDFKTDHGSRSTLTCPCKSFDLRVLMNFWYTDSKQSHLLGAEAFGRNDVLIRQTCADALHQ